MCTYLFYFILFVYIIVDLFMYPYICNGWFHLSPLSSHPTSPSCQFSDESAKAIFSEHAGVKKAWLQKPRAQATSGMRLVQVDVEGRTDGARILHGTPWSQLSHMYVVLMKEVSDILGEKPNGVSQVMVDPQVTGFKMF